MLIQKCFFRRGKKQNFKPAFTIIELLVVIVIIGILSTITLVSYGDITKKATVVSLKSYLYSASQQLELFKIEYNSYPTTINCEIPDDSTNKCIKTSSGITLNYANLGGSTNPQNFSLVAAKDSILYKISNDMPPTDWSSWIPGVSATVLEGKYVNNIDSGLAYYKTTNTAVEASFGVTGIDDNYMTNMVLINPSINLDVDFSTYPAQNICKSIGGRLPTTKELQTIFTNKITYGDNFQLTYYWSSTEYDGYSSYAVSMYDGSIAVGSKAYNDYVRCVSD